MALVTVRRTNDFFGRFRRVKVLVDGQQAADLKPNESTDISLGSGRHEVQGAMDWTRSQVCSIDVSDSAPIVVEFSMPFFDALIESFVRPKQAIKIKATWATQSPESQSR